MKKMVVVSKNKDPYLNQAMEACLFYEYKNYDEILFLYVNNPSVIIGRNQNPWQEIQIRNAVEKDVKVLRRLSGGGTVYHDHENLNFSFIYKKNKRSIKENFKVITDAIKTYDIDLRVTERNDLFYKDKKVSGNAFYNRGSTSMHHGTILIDVKTDHLWQILNFNHEHYFSKSVDSVKSPIVNLKHINKTLSIESVIEAIVKTYACEETLRDVELVQLHTEKITKWYQKYSEWQWIFGETPKFNFKKDQNNFTVDKGKIIDIDGNAKHNWMKNQMFSEEEVLKEVKDVSRII